MFSTILPLSIFFYGASNHSYTSFTSRPVSDISVTNLALPAALRYDPAFRQRSEQSKSFLWFLCTMHLKRPKGLQQFLS